MRTFLYNSHIHPPMSYYTYIYIISISLSIFWGVMVWRAQRNISGIFFLIFTLFSSLWFIAYYIFFSWILSSDILLYLSRFGFGIGVSTVYSLLYFLIYFGKSDTRFLQKSVLIPILTLLLIPFVYVSTDWIIHSLEYDLWAKVYREVTGPLFWLHIFAHFLFLALFVYFSFRTIQVQDNLNKIRLKHILFVGFLAVFAMLVLQLILPYFGIWMLEKEIIFIFTLFVISVPIITRRYYFSHIGYGIWRLLVAGVSLILAFAIMTGVRYGVLHINMGDLGYWLSRDSSSLFDIFFTIIVYFPVHHILQTILLHDDTILVLSSKFQVLKKSISAVTDIVSLNELLQTEMYTIFRARSSSIVLCPEYEDDLFLSSIQYFFQQNPTEKVFINDIVFLQQHREGLWISHTKFKISKDVFLAFPLHDTLWAHIGIFLLGTKRFGDFYTLLEIDMLRDFAFFLEIHLKYIRTYSAMQDLSMNLDRKVDEKTIEYNDLINRQKEFIGVISHEIKSPIAAAIFQSDSIIDDLDSPAFSTDVLRAELTVLNSQLVRTGWLISKLFSVQYYDTHAVNLFRENINFAKFLEYEIELFSHIYPDITFISDISTDIWFVEIDKIQFQQVINNLLDNAVKFASGMDSIIAISATKLGASLQLIIEDSGTGFQWVNINNIFDKYTTWNNWATGLGMWLYLCKKIISMHEGNIEASISTRYHGACFTILIPLK